MRNEQRRSELLFLVAGNRPAPRRYGPSVHAGTYSKEDQLFLLSLEWTPLHNLIAPCYHTRERKDDEKREVGEVAIMAVLAAGR